MTATRTRRYGSAARHAARGQAVKRLDRVPFGGRALRIDTILGASAWCVINRDEDLLFQVAGHDDETWEVGASLPPSTLDAIRAETAAAVARG